MLDADHKSAVSAGVQCSDTGYQRFLGTTHIDTANRIGMPGCIKKIFSLLKFFLIQKRPRNSCTPKLKTFEKWQNNWRLDQNYREIFNFLIPSVLTSLHPFMLKLKMISKQLWTLHILKKLYSIVYCFHYPDIAT